MNENNRKPIPPELEWKNIKGGIFEKMDSIETQKRTNSNKTSFRNPFWIFIISLCSFSIALFSIQKPIENSKEQNLLITQKSDISNLDNSIPSQEKTKGLSSNDLKDQSTHQTLKSSNSTKAPLIDNSESNSSQNSDVNLPTTFLLENNNVKSIENQGPDGVQLAIISMNSFQVNLGTPNDTFKSIEENKKEDKVESVTQKIRNTNSNELIFEGGSILWNEGHRKNPERSYETPLLSFQFQGSYKQNLQRNLFFMVGLHYQQLESKSEYSTTLQDYRVLLEDTIVRVIHDLSSGEQEIIRGNVEQFVDAEYKFRHYNTSKLLKASVSIGKSLQFNSFTSDLFIGLALNGLVQNEGRTFYNGSIIDYSEQENSLYQNQFATDVLVGGRIKYAVNPRFGLTSGLQIQNSITNWSTQNNIVFYPSSVAFQLGVSYNLIKN